MKFMVMHRHDKNTEAGKLPPPELIAAMGGLVGGMAQSGKLLDGEGLGASKTRSRITFKNGDRTVIHGPYKGSNELPAGFAKVSVQTREEAIELATKIGDAIGGDLEIEVGKLNEAWDLGMGEKPEGAPLRFLLVHKATPTSEAGHAPKLDAALKEIAGTGALLTSAMLTPSSQAKRLTWRGGNHKIVDGPFAESKELIGGYVILDMASMDECVAFCGEYAKLLLRFGDELEIDIRPV
jgi:hypothetical protein